VITHPIDIFVRYTLKAGQEEAYQTYLTSLEARMNVAGPGVLGYAVFQGHDGAYLQHERYVDEDAFNRHIMTISPLIERFNAVTQILNVRLVGELSDAFWATCGSANSHGFSLYRIIRRDDMANRGTAPELGSRPPLSEL